MAKTMDQVYAENAGALVKADKQGAWAYLREIREEKANIADNIAAVRNTNVKALQGVRQAMTSGSFAARTKAWVDLEKFLGTAATNYAKTAYAPDQRLEDTIDQAVTALKGGGATAKEIRKLAWETYYRNVDPRTQPNIATYNRMLRMYGVEDPDTHVMSEPTEGVDFTLTRDDQIRRRDLRNALAIERANAEKHATQLKALQAPAQEYKAWLERTGKQDDDVSRDEWYRATGRDLIARIPGGVEQGAFFDDLEKNVDAMNPELQKRLEDADKQEAWAMARLDREDGAGDTEPTWDDMMADWVARTNVQKWAAENGLEIGSVEEPTPELLQAIKEGKAPGYHVTKWGTVYKKGPDDMRAVKLADKQLKMRDGERSIFRPDDKSVKVEITLKGSVPREADVVQSGLTADGRVLAQLSDGAWVVADPPEDGAAFDWQRVPPEQEGAVRQGAELAPPTAPEKVSYGKQEPKTVVGYRQTTKFKDIQGSEYGTKLITEDGKPLWIPDSQAERVTYLTGGPPEPRVERARERWYQRAEAQDGTSGKEEQLGEKVDPRAEKMRLAEIAAAKVKPKDDRATRVQDERADAAAAEAERLAAVNPPGAAGWQRTTTAQSKAADARAEADAMRSPDTQIKTVPNATLDEKLRPVPSSDAAVREFTQRARAGESLGANQDKDAVDSTMGAKPILAPGQQSQTNPAFVTKPPPPPPVAETITRPDGGTELRQGALRDTRMEASRVIEAPQRKEGVSADLLGDATYGAPPPRVGDASEAEMRRRRAAYLEQRRAEAGQATP